MAEDQSADEQALATGGRLLSSDHTHAGETVWVMIEVDRSHITVLLPTDY